jgi:thiol-disulfide isomerase/thioredoxin
MSSLLLSLIDATSSSLTVSWPAVKEAKSYILQYRQGDDDDEASFETLSTTLTTTQARKNNLTFNEHGYVFRVKAADDDNWMTHEEPFFLLTRDQEENQMKAPLVSPAGNHALKVSWAAATTSGGYELQMRLNEGGAAWSTIAPSLTSTEVRKKNLTSQSGYCFRVRPASSVNDGHQAPFSPPSQVAVAAGLSEGIKRLFHGLENNSLVKNPNLTPVKLDDALGGKEFVLLYASAHWCPPCRQFTPMLANWYKTVQNQVEVVFLSCDHDEKGFEQYFAASHPWLAVNFDDDVRENLLAHIRVSGIPRLVVLDGKTGRILEDNAVGKQLDLHRWRQLAASK